MNVLSLSVCLLLLLLSSPSPPPPPLYYYQMLCLTRVWPKTPTAGWPVRQQSKTTSCWWVHTHTGSRGRGTANRLQSKVKAGGKSPLPSTNGVWCRPGSVQRSYRRTHTHSCLVFVLCCLLLLLLLQVFGEITSHAEVDYDAVARAVCDDIGYNNDVSVLL